MGGDEPRVDAEAPLTHFVRWDDPSAKSKRRQRAICGAWVNPRDVVNDRDALTCVECARACEEFEALEL